MATGPVECNEPQAFSITDRAAFEDKVRNGGEVGGNELHHHVEHAKALVFYRDGSLKGTAALKNPYDNYRKSITENSGTDLPIDAYRYELGYIFVDESARGRGVCKKLVEAAMSAAGNEGVFATTHADNIGMKKVLEQFGFEQSGKAYPSRDKSRQIQLFIRKKGTQSV